MHLRNWTYVAVDAICCQVAGVTPNLAYVSDVAVPGRTVKACQRGLGNLLHGTFGGSPVISGGGHSFLTMGEYRSKALSVVKPHEELEPLEHDHELRRLLENPNPWDTTFDLLYELQMFEELCGVSYLWVPPNSFGVPVEAWVIPSHWVWPRTGGGRILKNPEWATVSNRADAYVPPDNPYAERLIQYYEVRPWGGMGSAGMLRLPPNEVIMTLWKSPINKIDGYSKQAAIAQWIDSEESISKSRWSQFINQARPEFWVELGPGYEDLDDDRVARIEAKFMAKLQGEYNYGRPVITPAGAKITPLSFSPTEMAYYECLSEDTECLTADGWKKYTELSTGSLIACYDPAAGALVYHHPSAVHVFPYEGMMHHWRTKYMDALITPNHRVYVERATTAMEGGEITWEKRPYRDSLRTVKCRPGSKRVNKHCWVVRRAEELSATAPYRVLTAAPVLAGEPGPAAIPDWTSWRQLDRQPDREIAARDWLRFLGHWLSEGCMGKRKDGNTDWSVCVVQKKYAARFRKSLQALPYYWKESVRKDGVTAWHVWDKGLHQHLAEHCGTRSFDKHVPAYVKAWPAEYLRVLLAALLEGDGCSRESGWGGWRGSYFTSSRQLADDVMEIAVKCGFATYIRCYKDRRPEFAKRTRFKVVIQSKPDVPVSGRCRTQVPYKGNVWCVTVPTGLFVVRRNGKAHVTGNSEDQIRNMILSAFRVPGAVVGLVAEMTYGSVLATLSAFCTYGINPRLRMKGQRLTKSLASRWDEQAPAYSTYMHGAGPSYRHVRLWWDDCSPADPAQVNADLAEDRAHSAITPNEVRALRGRRPYGLGGDNPLVQGPGGIMPLPLNKEEPMGDLGTLIGQFAQHASGQGSEQAGMGPQGAMGPGVPGGAPGLNGGAGPGVPGLPAGPSPAGGRPEEGHGADSVSLDQTTELDDQSAGIEGPNGPPAKAFAFHKGKTSVRELLFKVGEELAQHSDPAPMPGYGQIFLKDGDEESHGSGIVSGEGKKKARVWYVGGDGDEDGFVDVVEEKIRAAFPGVHELTIEAEVFPPRDEAGWVQVYPRPGKQLVLGEVRKARDKEDAQGGIVYETQEDLERAQDADLLTLPEGVSGTSCGNCLWIREAGKGHFCSHVKIRLPVNQRMCCSLWDNKDVLRAWAETDVGVGVQKLWRHRGLKGHGTQDGLQRKATDQNPCPRKATDRGPCLRIDEDLWRQVQQVTGALRNGKDKP